MAVSAVSAIVAAAIPTHAVEDRSVSIVELPPKLDRSAGFPLVVAGHRVTVTPPDGYAVVQVGSGDASHAHVTLGPVDGPGEVMVVRFEAPSDIRLGAIVGVHQGTAVRETRFGTLWRSPFGIVVLVSGDSAAAQLAAIDGLRIEP